MTEGGGATSDGTKVTRVNIGTAEKLPARARLVATGTAGHGSVPRLDNALIHLSAAVEKTIAAFNDEVLNDERVESVILPLADGMTMARRK